MSEPPGDPDPDELHRRPTLRWLLAALTGVWAAVTFVPPLFARVLQFDVFGLPFALWMAAQGAPIVYVILVWICERRASRLEAAPRGDRAEP
jgi:putative solute:sodium symporter small subunit